MVEKIHVNNVEKILQKIDIYIYVKYVEKNLEVKKEKDNSVQMNVVEKAEIQK